MVRSWQWSGRDEGFRLGCGLAAYLSICRSVSSGLWTCNKLRLNPSLTSVGRGFNPLLGICVHLIGQKSHHFLSMDNLVIVNCSDIIWLSSDIVNWFKQLGTKSMDGLCARIWSFDSLMQVLSDRKFELEYTLIFLNFPGLLKLSYAYKLKLCCVKGL